MPGTLNGERERALTLRGELRLAPRLDLAALREETAQPGHVLVVDVVDTIRGEDIHPAPPATTATETAAATATAAPTAETATAAPTTTVPPAFTATTGAIIGRGIVIRLSGLRTLLVNHDRSSYSLNQRA